MCHFCAKSQHVELWTHTECNGISFYCYFFRFPSHQVLCAVLQEAPVAVRVPRAERGPVRPPQGVEPAPSAAAAQEPPQPEAKEAVVGQGEAGVGERSLQPRPAKKILPLFSIFSL